MEGGWDGRVGMKVRWMGRGNWLGREERGERKKEEAEGINQQGREGRAGTVGSVRWKEEGCRGLKIREGSE